MKTLIVGAGALGGIIGARLLAVGASVSLATRNATSAEEIKASGLRVTGIGGDLSIETGEVAPSADYSVSGSFDLIVLGASLLQDFERERTTEIDFINGYVVDTARQFGVNTPVNTAIVETVYAITRGQSAPDANHLGQILQNSR
jgi:ketopantoate reductase